MYEEVEPRQSKPENFWKAGCFLSLWGVIILSTFLSTACTWGFVNSYDKSETNHSLAAAIMTSIALCGSTLGYCGCCAGGSESKMGMGILYEIVRTVDCDNELANCIKILAFCGLFIVIVPSFGILQLASGGVMVRSLVLNTATNVKVFAGFIAAFDFIAALCGVFFPCFLCSVAGNH